MDTWSAESRNRLRQAIDDGIRSSVESTRALKFRHNALAPISRLPPETLAAIFSVLPPSTWNKDGRMEWIRVAHVCHRWREIALNYSRFWSYINFTKLTPAAAAEILARAKMAPLHLEIDLSMWSIVHPLAFEGQLEAHISHVRHLSIAGCLRSSLDRLVSFAPTLEFLTLLHRFYPYTSQIVIPINLFNSTTPRLTSLELQNCDISWKSPLLKGLRTLKILNPSRVARPKLGDWMDALNEMPQLETLVFQDATPLASRDAPLMLEPSRTVTLPFLTRFRIFASAKDCALALAHLVLPALGWLYVDAESHDEEGEDVRLVIPYVSRNIDGLQDTEPLRSLLISGERKRARFLAWTMPDVDPNFCNPNTFYSVSFPARLTFAATCRHWNHGVDTAIFDSLLTHLPVNSVSTLATQERTRLSKEFWLSHAPRLPLLERARLVPTAIKAFRDVLVEDTPPDGPRFSLLTKLVLFDVTLTALRTFHLRDMLMERVEQGVPLEVLDLSACVAVDRAIQLLREIVVDVQEPPATESMPMDETAFSNWDGGIGRVDEVEYDDNSWYDDSDEDEDEDEDDVDYDQFMDYDYDYDYDYDAVSIY